MLRRLCLLGLVLWLGACGGSTAPSPTAGTLDAGSFDDGFASADAVVDAAVDAATSADASPPQDLVNPSADTNPADAGAPLTVVLGHHPQAGELALRGDQPPLSWETDFAPVSVTGTEARFELKGLTQAVHVKLVRKGQWALGNNHTVPANDTRDLYPYFDPKQVAGRREDFQLKGQDGAPRTVRMWLPPGYDENTAAAYPLLVMMDGQNLFEHATAGFGVAWRVQDAALKAMAEAHLGEVVIAGVDHGDEKRIDEYTPWYDPAEKMGGGGEKTALWLESTVLPELAKRYRLQPGRASRVIGGSSLGGLMSLYVLQTHPATWGGAMAMSGSWWWKNLSTKAWLAQVWSPLPVRVWLDAGTQNDGLADTQVIRQTLLDLGLKEPSSLGFYVHQGAGHNEASWGARVHLPLAYFFDPGDLQKPF